MSANYDKQILDCVAASDRPLRHREIAHRIAPGNNRAWSQIGGRLTMLYRAGLLSREKTDGRYWHYMAGDGRMSETKTPFEPITVSIILDTDRDDKDEQINYVAAIEVLGTTPEGKKIELHYEDEPPMQRVDFWRWLATQHGWALDDC